MAGVKWSHATLVEVQALKKHSSYVADESDEAHEKASQPLSEIDLDAMQTWLETKKPILKTLETDLRDAKRRISVAKGPKTRQAAAPDNGEGRSEDESSVASEAA